MLELYKNIKKYRLEMNITQQELAEKAGYKDKSMIAKIEKGLIDLPQSKIEKFAEIFNVSQSDLMGWDSLEAKDKKPGMYIDDKRIDITPLIMSILENVAEMPVEQQKLVNNMVGGNDDNKPKKNIIFVSNPQYAKFSNGTSSNTKRTIPFTDYDEAVAFLSKQDMLAACSGDTLEKETVLQMANAILEQQNKKGI